MWGKLKMVPRRLNDKRMRPALYDELTHKWQWTFCIYMAMRLDSSQPEAAMGPALGQSKFYCSEGLRWHNKVWAMMEYNLSKMSQSYHNCTTNKMLQAQHGWVKVLYITFQQEKTADVNAIYNAILRYTPLENCENRSSKLYSGTSCIVF